jgi:hypothetical protein
MSSPRDLTDNDIDAELAAAEQRMQEEMAEKRRVAQERKAALNKAKEEKVRKVEEARLKAEAEEKAKAEAKAEAERLAKEAQDKAAAKEKAEKVHLANWKRLAWELIEFKERNAAEEKRKAEEREKLKADKGMMLASSADISAIERAWQVNAENARIRAEGVKPPRAGTSKAPATPKPKPTDSVNLSRQVRNEEAMRKSGKLGKTGEVAVSYLLFFLIYFISAFLTCPPGDQLRHVQGPKRPLCLWDLDGLQDMQRTQSSVLVLGQAKAKG